MSGIVIWFEAAAVVPGTDQDGLARWKIIHDVLTALGCTDIHLRETERYPPAPARDSAEVER